MREKGQQEGSRPEVLIVDDDKYLCASLEMILNEVGYGVLSVFNGADALQAAQEHEFDAAIIDIRLPDIDGVEVLRRLSEKDTNMGIMMVSGEATVETAVGSLNQGADAFLLKPVNARDLISMLERITRLKAAQREIERQRLLLDDLYENAPVMYLSVDTKGIVRSINRTMADNLGFSKDEILDGPISRLRVTDPSCDTNKQPTFDLSADLNGSEWQLRRKDGSIIDTLLDFSEEYDNEGNLYTKRVVFRDVTEKKLAESNLRELVFKLNGVSQGCSYLCSEHELAFRIFRDLTFHGVPGLCLTRNNPEELETKYGIHSENIILISSREMVGRRHVSNLQEVNRVVSDFLENNVSPIVILDGLEYLISRFEFDIVYTFIQEIRFDFMEKRGILLIPVHPQTLSEREMALLTSEIMLLE
ncbi:MAG: response regulator [Candidatus Bathyarchaeota archaeon]|nr:response regulator [Candidatus Bathyarchaeota archaeon]